MLMNTPSPTKNCHPIPQTFCHATPNFYSVSLLQTKYSHHTLTFFPPHPPKMFCYHNSKNFDTPPTPKFFSPNPRMFLANLTPNLWKICYPNLLKISAILSLKLFCNSTPPRNILVCHLTHKCSWPQQPKTCYPVPPIFFATPPSKICSAPLSTTTVCPWFRFNFYA